MTSAAGQGRILLAMMLAGAAVGMACDVLAVLFRAAPGVLKGQAVRDVLSGVLFALGVASAALRLRVDAFRWYVILGALGGVGLYRLSIGSALRQMAGYVMRLCRKIHPKERKTQR